MFSEARISDAFKAMLSSIEIPPVPLRDIQQRVAQATSRERPRHRWFWYLPASAVTAIIVLALPKVAPGLTQTIEQQVGAILHLTSPPPAPGPIESAMRSQTGSLAAAQARVSFTIVPPAGLPADALLGSIVTAPTGVYSRVTRRWSVGTSAVWFIYRRPGGRTFSLMAERFDPREGPPSKYWFEYRGVRDGRIFVIRHDKFTWRNGEQVMSATAEGISAVEIARIAAAMNGTTIPGVWPPQHGSIEKQFRVEFPSQSLGVPPADGRAPPLLLRPLAGQNGISSSSSSPTPSPEPDARAPTGLLPPL
jgi:hypothetical protein